MAIAWNTVCVILLVLSYTRPGLCNRRSKAIKHIVAWDPSVTEELEYGKIYNMDVNINEYMDIFCPQYDADAPENQVLTFVIYNVSQESFNGCTRTEASRKIFECNTPSKSKKLTTKFQQRSPNPLGFVFIPGSTYFYIAFNDEGENKNDPCKSAMRMKINVDSGRAHTHSKATPPMSPSSTTVVTTTPTPATSKTTTAATTTTTTTTSTTKKTTTIISRIYRNSTPQKQVGATPKNAAVKGGAAHITFTTTWTLLTLLVTAYLRS